MKWMRALLMGWSLLLTCSLPAAAAMAATGHGIVGDTAAAPPRPR